MPEDEDFVDDDMESEEAREELVDSGALSPGEEGFLQGASGGGQGAKCRKCGKVLDDDFIERRDDENEICRFCSDECSEKYFEKKKK